MWLIYENNENEKITFTRVASEKEAIDQIVEHATMTICDRTDNNQQEVERFLNDVKVHKGYVRWTWKRKGYWECYWFQQELTEISTNIEERTENWPDPDKYDI